MHLVLWIFNTCVENSIKKEISNKKQIIPLLVDCNGEYTFPIID